MYNIYRGDSMILIKSLKVTEPFMYIWLKNVKDVNLNVHCAKCLIGDYNTNINKNTHEIYNLQLNNDVYYLCGVSKPYNWNKNFHLAFKYSPNCYISYSNNGISVEIKNAIPLPILPKYIDHELKYSNLKEYNTCRNWQFANYFKSNEFQNL